MNSLFIGVEVSVWPDKASQFLDDEERLRNSSSSLNPVIVVIVVALFMKYQHINGVVIVVCYFH